MLPLLIKSGWFSFSCCNQISRCLENNLAWNGSKVTRSESCHIKFNYIHCFYYSKSIGSPWTQQKILLYFIQYGFYAKRKKGGVLGRGRKMLSPSTFPIRRHEAAEAQLISQAQLFHCASPPQQHTLPRDTVCLNITHLMESLKLSQFHRF